MNVHCSVYFKHGILMTINDYLLQRSSTVVGVTPTRGLGDMSGLAHNAYSHFILALSTDLILSCMHCSKLYVLCLHSNR